MLRGKKIGRRADSVQRQKAQDLVDLYRAAAASSDQRYCVNPGDPPEERAFVTYSDPNLLISALECFAKNGTFTDPFADTIKLLLMRDQFKKLRTGGMTYEKAVALMVNEYSSSTSVIERAVKPSVRVTD